MTLNALFTATQLSCCHVEGINNHFLNVLVTISKLCSTLAPDVVVMLKKGRQNTYPTSDHRIHNSQYSEDGVKYCILHSCQPR